MSVLTEKMRGEIVELLPRYPQKQAVTLPALHIVQDELRCVPRGSRPLRLSKSAGSPIGAC